MAQDRKNQVANPESEKSEKPAYPVLAEMKGCSLKNVGKDPKTGKVIPHERTEKVANLVSHLVACGASENDISAYLNIRPGLLRQHYAHELDTGAFPHNMEVASAILHQAKEGNLNAGIYWTKVRMGWKDGENQGGQGLLNIHIHT